MGFDAKFNLGTYQVGPALWERCHISLGSEGEGAGSDAQWQNLNVKLQVRLGIQCRRAVEGKVR